MGPLRQPKAGTIAVIKTTPYSKEYYSTWVLILHKLFVYIGFYYTQAVLLLSLKNIHVLHIGAVLRP